MSKQYSTRILRKEDEAAIDAMLAKHPLWTRKVARDTIARSKFQQRITEAGKK